jgi:microcystin-dependent protein
MGTPYLGEIRMVSFGFAPKGWALCNGQAMPISQNQALFSLLGTTFGGDGKVNFMLPDLRGRVPTNAGSLAHNPALSWGQKGGEEQHTLLQTEMPGHTHTAVASSAGPTAPAATSNYWANGTTQLYGNPPNTPMAINAIANNGNNQPHENRSPYTVVNFVIALVGIFPTRN